MMDQQQIEELRDQVNQWHQIANGQYVEYLEAGQRVDEVFRILNQPMNPFDRAMWQEKLEERKAASKALQFITIPGFCDNKHILHVLFILRGQLLAIDRILKSES